MKKIPTNYVKNCARFTVIACLAITVATRTTSLASTDTGLLDTTFDGDGKLTTPVGSGEDSGRSMAIQTDGKIVVAGESDYEGGFYGGGRSDFAVVRYNTDGTLDNTFGTGGQVTTPVRSGNNFVKSMAIQTDGKIVVAGTSIIPGTGVSEFAVVRYNTNGTLDNTFDTDGKVATQIGSSYSFVGSMAIQTNGKIVVAGQRRTGASVAALVRYNVNGALDETFGTGGIVTTPIGSFEDGSISSVAIQTDGKIVVAGSGEGGSNADFAVIRFTTDGTLDTTFGTGGIVTTDLGSMDRGSSIAIQTDGKIVVSGQGSIGFNSAIALARYDTSGTLDTTFGIGGIVKSAVGSMPNFTNPSMAIQTDGKIVVPGSFATNPPNSELALVRFASDGTLDTTFDGDGIVTTSFGGNSQGSSVAIQTNGKIVVAGQSFNGTDRDFAVVRYNATSTSPAAEINTTTTTTAPATTTTTAPATTTTTAPATAMTTIAPATTTTTVPATTTVVSIGKTISVLSAAKQYKVTIPKGATVRVTIAKSSLKKCSVSKNAAVKGLAKGTCSLTVSITPKKTTATPKPKTTRGVIRIVVK